MTVGEYIYKYPEYKNEIESINALFKEFGMHVDEVVKGAQIIRYKLLLPIDLKVQDKVRKSDKAIRYSLSSAINTDEFTYQKSMNYVYIEKRASDFKPVLFEDYIGNLPPKGLYLLLGKDIDGHNMYTNLSKAPHILVAGTTGAGKSELLHTFIASLITRRKQNPCRLILIDPKRAEFAVYKNRMDIDLITDMNQAANKLSWAVDEMESRYKILEQNRCKDIYELNDPSIHPYVIIIDEMADLLMSNKNAEKYIIRLAQKARACGIHLILGTQRPCKDVVTGLIKANIPTKIALNTTDSIQSRIILDRSGAENLIGHGDMLFLGNGSLSPIRIQAAYLPQASKEKIASSLPCHEEVSEPKLKYTIDFQRPLRITPDGFGVIYDDEPNVEYRMDGTKVYHEPVRQTVATKAKPKRVGLIRGFINLMNVKPLMFVSSEYPPRI